MSGGPSEQPSGAVDPMTELFAEAQHPDLEGARANRNRRSAWVLAGLSICLAYGLGFSLLLGVDVALGWFEGSLDSMVANHPAFAALWFLAEPAFLTYYTAGPVAGMFFGVPAGRITTGVIVGLYAFPVAVVQAALVVTSAALVRSAVVLLIRRSRRADATD